MMRNLLIAAALFTAIGCDNKNSNNGTPDMAKPTADMAMPTCFTGTPAADEDFLNACTTADSVEITPFYPDKAPNGELPALP